MRKRAPAAYRWLSFLLFPTLFLLACGAGVATSADRADFALDWVVTGGHAGFFVATEKGLYSKEGLDVTIHRGFGSGDTVKKVASGKMTFGLADSGALIIARTKGTAAKLVGIFNERSMYVIYSLADRRISTPKDLVGKTVATSLGNAAYISFPVLAAVNGIDPTSVKWEIMSPGSQIPSLLAGKVDASVHFAMSGPIIAQGAAKVGKRINGLYYSDWGVDVYSSGLIVLDDLIAKKREFVRRFVVATMKGLAWAVEHPVETVDILVKSHPALDRQAALDGWKVSRDHLFTPNAKRYGIGYILRDKMERTRDIVVKANRLEKKVDAAELYTNAFLPKLIPAP